MTATLQLCVILSIIAPQYAGQNSHNLKYEKDPAPDGHRCGVCPTYFQKICAFDQETNSTYIFDNHCIMDLHNCMHGSSFWPLSYDNCIYFGNFAYVHGYKYEDEDYEESPLLNSHRHPKKNPPFVK